MYEELMCKCYEFVRDWYQVDIAGVQEEIRESAENTLIRTDVRVVSYYYEGIDRDYKFTGNFELTKGNRTFPVGFAW